MINNVKSKEQMEKYQQNILLILLLASADGDEVTVKTTESGIRFDI